MNYSNLYYGYNETNIYLDNAASTLSFRKVKETADLFLQNYGSLHRGSGYNSEHSTELYEASREYILERINGQKDKDCVIFTANTTDAINKFCLIYPSGKQKKVLISDIEHTSNVLPWEKHFSVKVFKTNDFIISPDQIKEELDKDNTIEIVAISAASNITGYITDVKGIYDICKEKGVILFVDASQYAPHKCPDLQECDVIAYCGHKMGAPFGCGILAGRKKLLAYDNMSITGGGNVIYVDENNNPYYKELPYIHEAGTPNGIGAVAVATAHKVLFDEIGEKELHSHSSELNQAIRTCSQDLKKNGYEVFFADTTENRTPIMVINNKFISNKETVIKLNSVIGDMDKNVFVREGAFCAYRLLEKINPNLRDIKEKIVDGKLDSRYSLIRLSAGVINTPEDIYYASRKLIKINENL